MPVQAQTTRRKTRWSTQPPRPSAGIHAQPYRQRRPETTTLHRIVREHLETYLALANESDPIGESGPDHVEKEFRSYLTCGILAHGFARARCSSCGHDFLVAFSCKGRGACPSCNAKRMVETAAHLVDHVIPHLPVRQFVLSVPKRLRPFLHHRHRTATAVLHILLRALRATLREACPTAPADASFGAVSFLHRFGSSLNPHFHFHLCVVDGLFQWVENDTNQDPANPETRLRFHEATALTHELLGGLQHTVRKRVLRQFIELRFASFDGLAGQLLGALRAVISKAARLRRQGLLEPHDAEDMLAWDHGGGFSLDAGVRIEATDQDGLERLIRHCARPPFALDRLHLVGGRSDRVLYLLPGPDLRRIMPSPLSYPVPLFLSQHLPRSRLPRQGHHHPDHPTPHLPSHPDGPPSWLGSMKSSPWSVPPARHPSPSLRCLP